MTFPGCIGNRLKKLDDIVHCGYPLVLMRREVRILDIAAEKRLVEIKSQNRDRLLDTPSDVQGTAQADILGPIEKFRIRQIFLGFLDCVAADAMQYKLMPDFIGGGYFFVL